VGVAIRVGVGVGVGVGIRVRVGVGVGVGVGVRVGVGVGIRVRVRLRIPLARARVVSLVVAGADHGQRRPKQILHLALLSDAYATYARAAPTRYPKRSIATRSRTNGNGPAPRRPGT